MMLETMTTPRVEGMIRVGDDGIERTWNGQVWQCPDNVDCDFCDMQPATGEVPEAVSSSWFREPRP